MTTAQKNLTRTALVIAAFLSMTLPARAQSAIGLSAIPPRLELKIEAGNTVTKEIKVRNESQQERVINTTVKDFIVTDAEGTPVQVDGLEEGSNRWAASHWIQVSPSKLILKPGETKSLMVTVIAPDDALPGGHYSMVLHNPQNEAMLTETGSFIETNVGTLVYITIPGDINEKALVKDFSAPSFQEYGPVNFKTVVTNLSDIHVTPVGTINITNMFGGRTANLVLPATNIFPNTNRTIESTLNRKWLFGRYVATLNAAYGTTGQALTSAIVFWVIPWKLMILVLGAIALFVLLLVLIRRQSIVETESDEKVEELEHELEALKKKYRDRK